MCQFIETLQIKNKTLQKIKFHNDRFNRTRHHFFSANAIELEKVIVIPNTITNDVYRCRIVYSREIETIEFIPYTPKNIHTLKIVECNEIDYSFKYADRSLLNQLFEKRDDCDDIIIVKNGFITDTSSANIILFDGNQWHTPIQPLLKGTKRAQLLAEGRITEKEIRTSDLKDYQHLRLTNALLDEGFIIPISAIKF